MEQQAVIKHVLDVYNAAVASQYAVARCPDEQNRGSADVDAIATSPGLRSLAIEHTKVESLQDQNRDSAWFMRGLGALATELDGVFPFVLDLVFPYENVIPGQDWACIRTSLKTWLLDNAELLPNGRTTHQIAGVPFPIVTSKRSGNLHKVFLVRQTPPGDSDAQLLTQMRESLNHKYERLGEYRTQDHVALLIIESEDIALVSEQDLYRAFLRATHEEPRPDLDQVWLASTCLDDCSVYCLRGPADVRAGVNPEQFHFGPEYVAEWLPEVM